MSITSASWSNETRRWCSDVNPLSSALPKKDEASRRHICSLPEQLSAVDFSDGTTQEIDFGPIIEQFSPTDYRTIYRQPEQFQAFGIEAGNLVWGED